MMLDTRRNQFEGGEPIVPVQPYGEIDLVNTTSARILLKGIANRIESGGSFAVATLNLDHVVKLRTQADFLAAYRKHNFVVADGNPIVWLRRIAKAPVDLVTGADLIEPLMAMAAQRGIPVAFLGATDETLQAASEILKDRHPGLNIVACIAPPYGLDPDGPAAAEALETLAQSGAQLCLLSLGAPKQELLAARGLSLVPNCGFVSIGAGLDFIAGHQRRAPKWMRRLALEWLWRFLNNPRRLASRYWGCLRILPGLLWQAFAQRRARADHDIAQIPGPYRSSRGQSPRQLATTPVSKAEKRQMGR